MARRKRAPWGSKNSLLSKAKAAPNGSGRTSKYDSDQMMELAVAWARGEVNIHQVAKALSMSNQSSFVALARGLRRYVNQ